MMAYLYSAPLVFIDEFGEPKPVPELEYQTEQQRVLETLKEMHLAVRWRTYVATTHNFLAAASQCQILHFTGHGEDGNVMFEDEHGKGLLKTQQQIQDLFSGAVRSDLYRWLMLFFFLPALAVVVDGFSAVKAAAGVCECLPLGKRR